MLYIHNGDQAPMRNVAAGEDVYELKHKQQFNYPFNIFNMQECLLIYIHYPLCHDCHYRYINIFFQPNNKEYQDSAVAELIKYYARSYHDGPLADTDINCSSKYTDSLDKIRKVHIHCFAPHVHN